MTNWISKTTILLLTCFTLVNFFIQPTAAQSSTFTIMSYNLKHWGISIGSNLRTNDPPDEAYALAQYVNDHQIDYVSLQELAKETRTIGGRDQTELAYIAQILTQVTGQTWYATTTGPLPYEEHLNLGAVSRYPFTSYQYVAPPANDGNQRPYLDATINLNGQSIRMITVHPIGGATGRLMQRLGLDNPATGLQTKTIISGDFNWTIDQFPNYTKINTSDTGHLIRACQNWQFTTDIDITQINGNSIDGASQYTDPCLTISNKNLELDHIFHLQNDSLNVDEAYVLHTGGGVKTFFSHRFAYTNQLSAEQKKQFVDWSYLFNIHKSDNPESLEQRNQVDHNGIVARYRILAPDNNPTVPTRDYLRVLTWNLYYDSPGQALGDIADYILNPDNPQLVRAITDLDPSQYASQPVNIGSVNSWKPIDLAGLQEVVQYSYGTTYAEATQLQQILQNKRNRLIAYDSRLSSIYPNQYTVNFSPHPERGPNDNPNRITGLALVSRLPLSNFDAQEQFRGRVAQSALIQTPFGPLRHVNMHITEYGLTATQCPGLEATIDYYNNFSDNLKVLTGDFNIDFNSREKSGGDTNGLDSECGSLLLNQTWQRSCRYGQEACGADFSRSIAPGVIDYIFANSPLTVQNSIVGMSYVGLTVDPRNPSNSANTNNGISDHAPVWTEIKFPPHLIPTQSPNPTGTLPDPTDLDCCNTLDDCDQSSGLYACLPYPNRRCNGLTQARFCVPITPTPTPSPLPEPTNYPCAYNDPTSCQQDPLCHWPDGQFCQPELGSLDFNTICGRIDPSQTNWWQKLVSSAYAQLPGAVPIDQLFTMPPGLNSQFCTTGASCQMYMSPVTSEYTARCLNPYGEPNQIQTSIPAPLPLICLNYKDRNECPSSCYWDNLTQSCAPNPQTLECGTFCGYQAEYCYACKPPCGDFIKLDDQGYRCTGPGYDPYQGYKQIPYDQCQGLDTLAQQRCQDCRDQQQGTWTAFGCLPNQPTQLIASLLQSLFNFTGGLALIILIYATFLCITSRGNPDRVQACRQTITSLVVGLILLICALWLIRVIFGPTGFLPGIIPYL